jgi:hypothetical protein
VLHKRRNGINLEDLLIAEVLVEAGESGEIALLSLVGDLSDVLEVDENLSKNFLVHIEERPVAAVEEAGYGSKVRPVAPHGLGAVPPQTTIA